MSVNDVSSLSFSLRMHTLSEYSVIKNNDVVIYLMQNSIRTEYNHALEYAIIKANELNKPLMVIFLLDENEHTTERHMAFLLEGLKDVKNSLQKRDIPFFVYNSKIQILLPIIKKASTIVTDKSYLKQQQQQNNFLANLVNVPIIEIESNAIVPVEVASEKEEYAAYTIRPKLNRHLNTFLQTVQEEKYDAPPLTIKWLSQFKQYEVSLENIDALLKTLSLDNSVKKSKTFIGGQTKAKEVLKSFINNRLPNYENNRNDPSKDGASNLSPYLKFGFISPLEIYLLVKASRIINTDAFLEQLFVRRELSINFTYYNSNYDNYNCLPPWAKRTLEDHMFDKRENLYTLEQLENANTLDPYWNASQKEMMLSSKMHNYMRMYWGKRLLEWFVIPMEAYHTALYLNNKYSLEGFDANSYAGVAWCFGKHDRPWFEKPVFGLVRYMNANGLNSKFNMSEYLKKIDKLK